MSIHIWKFRPAKYTLLNTAHNLMLGTRGMDMHTGCGLFPVNMASLLNHAYHYKIKRSKCNSMVLFEKCMVIPLVISCLQNLHWMLLRTTFVHSTPSHPAPLRYILVLSQPYLMAISFLAKIIYASFMFSMCAACPTHLYSFLTKILYASFMFSMCATCSTHLYLIVPKV